MSLRVIWLTSLILTSLILAKAANLAPQLNCMPKILRNLYNDIESLLIVINDDKNGLINDYETPYYLINFEKRYSHIFSVPKHLMFSAKTSRAFFEMFDKFVSSSLWDNSNAPRSKYVIFLETPNSNVTEIFVYLNKYKIVLVQIYENVNETLWKRYNKNNFCKAEYVIKYLDCGSEMSKINWLEVPPNGIKHCNFSVAYASQSFTKIFWIYNDNTRGIILKPFELFAAKYKVNVEYYLLSSKEQYNFQIGSEMWRGNEMLNKDALAVSPLRSIYQTYMLDQSDIISRDDFIWLIPPPREKSKFHVIVSVYKWQVWMGLCFITILTALTFWVIVRPDNTLSNSIIHIVMISFGTTGLSRMPKSKRLRLLVMFYIVYSFQTSNFFQCNLSGILTSPSYEERIEDVAQLSRTQLQPIVFADGAVSLMRKSSNPYIKQMSYYTKTSNEKEINYYINMLHLYRNVTLLIHPSKLKAIDIQLNDNIPKADFFKPELCYVMKQGSFYFNYINDIIMTLHENGFLIKWTYWNIPITPIKNIRHLRILSLRHLQFAFVVQIVGYVLAFVIFILEQIKQRYVARIF